MKSDKTKGNIALSIGAFFVLLACVCVVVVIFLHARADAPAPCPTGQGAELDIEGDAWPEVDWQYWASINPDVVGWVSIPNTNISQPIVQASETDPQYYLYHDVYGTPNYMGCPYIDAACANGLNSLNCVVFGHNMGGDDQSMFGDLEYMTDANYAAEHATVLLQTPQEKRKLKVRFASITEGWLASERTEFLDNTDYTLWYTEQLDSADMVLGDTFVPTTNITFCTCSYSYWSNERTLVYASTEKTKGKVGSGQPVVEQAPDSKTAQETQ